jgi:predicted transcriptional regulator
VQAIRLRGRLRRATRERHVLSDSGQAVNVLLTDAVGPATVGETVLSRVLEKIYEGSPLELLMHFLERRTLSEGELARMRKMLEQHGGDR